MPRLHMTWRHIIINTRCSWLHGDERGFRSRRHRIHSSGDYRHRPPADEHEGLRQYHEDRSGEEIHRDHALRPTIGRTIIAYLLSEGFRVVAVAVGKVHAHVLAELPTDLLLVKLFTGHAKRKSSRAVKKQLPGSVWAAGGTFKPVENQGHLDRAYSYILYDQGPEAWTWCAEDSSEEGQYGRVKTNEKPTVIHW